MIEWELKEANSRFANDHQHETSADRLLSVYGHPSAMDYTCVRRAYDVLRYASGTGSRFLTYISPCEFSTLSKPSFVFRRPAPVPFHGEFKSDWMVRHAYEGFERSRLWLEFSLVTHDRQLAERVAGFCPQHSVIGESPSFPSSYEVLVDHPDAIWDAMDAVVAVHGSLEVRLASAPDLPMEGKALEWDAVEQVEVRPSTVAVPLVMPGRLGSRESELAKLAAFDLLSAVSEGFSPREAMKFLEAVLPTQEANRLIKAAKEFSAKGTHGFW